MFATAQKRFPESSMQAFKNLVIVGHPLVQHKLTLMRKTETPTVEFRRLLKEISMLMVYEITRNLPLTTQKIKTPLTEMDAPILDGRKPAVIGILRAGLGMTDGMMELMPLAREGHIGLYRDHDTKNPNEYFIKLPDLEDRYIILCDPMLATGNSACYALQVLTERGVEEDRIHLLSLVSAPEGIREIESRFPNVSVFTASLDDHLDENAYIVPGLGDAGDRLFGTK